MRRRLPRRRFRPHPPRLRRPHLRARAGAQPRAPPRPVRAGAPGATGSVAVSRVRLRQPARIRGRLHARQPVADRHGLLVAVQRHQRPMHVAAPLLQSAAGLAGRPAGRARRRRFDGRRRPRRRGGGARSHRPRRGRLPAEPRQPRARGGRQAAGPDAADGRRHGSRGGRGGVPRSGRRRADLRSRLVGPGGGAGRGGRVAGDPHAGRPRRGVDHGDRDRRRRTRRQRGAAFRGDRGPVRHRLHRPPPPARRDPGQGRALHRASGSDRRPARAGRPVAVRLDRPRPHARRHAGQTRPSDGPAHGARSGVRRIAPDGAELHGPRGAGGGHRHRGGARDGAARRRRGAGMTRTIGSSEGRSRQPRSPRASQPTVRRLPAPRGARRRGCRAWRSSPRGRRTRRSGPGSTRGAARRSTAASTCRRRSG